MEPDKEHQRFTSTTHQQQQGRDDWNMIGDNQALDLYNYTYILLLYQQELFILWILILCLAIVDDVVSTLGILNQPMTILKIKFAPIRSVNH